MPIKHAAAALPALMLLAACAGENSQSERRAAAHLDLDICALASADEMLSLHRKLIHATPRSSSCAWSEEPDSMSYLDIGIRPLHQDVRKYFPDPTPAGVTLEEVSDLGDGGYMTITEGRIGVVVVRKGKYAMQSAPIFIDVEPGSEQQRKLWDIYRRALNLVP